MVQQVIRSKWNETDPVDLIGNEFNIGDKVVRACTSGRAASIEVLEVTKIECGRIFVGGSKVPVNYPGRLLIVTKIIP